MRTVSIIVIAFLVAIAPFSVAAGKSESDTKPVNVLVTIAGDPACAFLPENYVLLKTPKLDKVFFATAEDTEKSVEQFISVSCENLIERLDQTYGLLMKGFACSIRESNIPRLRRTPGVVKVEMMPEYKLFDIDTHADSPAVTKAKDAWNLKDPQGRPVTGTGQIIGIIDTGLDWRHPALGGKFGTNAKVINGVDYSTGKGIEVDPQTHGTQVAGAAAGNGKYKGSAPDAKLIGYKIYPEVEGGGGTDVGANILKAVEQSVSMKCTVINLSLGAAGGGSGEEVGNEPFRNASKAGVMICAAAGNNGARSDTKGFQVASPSTIPPVLSCAATDDTRHLTITISAPESEKDSKITGTPFDNPELWPAGEYSVVDCGYGAPEDFTDKDLTGKIALIKRGPIGPNAIRFKDKALRAKEAGAVGCVIYNYSLTSYSGTMYAPDDKDRPPLIPSIGTTYTQGFKLKNLIDKGLTVSVGMSDAFGMMTDFSSMGPSSDYKFKPEVAAPGLGVMCPVYMGLTPDLNNPPYNAFSGTSCATPVISGVAALVRQKNPNDPPQLIKCRLMSTANLLFNQSANEYIPLSLQGSGRVDAVKAMTTNYYFNPPSLSLKSLSNVMNSSIKLFNLTKDKKQAKLSYWSLGRNSTCKLPETIDLLPNGETDFDITVTCDPDSTGVLEGLVFADIGDVTIHIPMIMVNGSGGVTRRMSDLRISTEKMDFDDPKIPSITFRINFGQFEANTPGRDVTSNFAAGRLDVYNSDGYIGSILMDDAMQVGYYNIHWDGTDYLKRLFIPSGDYVIKAVGLDSLVDGGTMMIRNQSDPPSVPLKVMNSPLLQMPSIKMNPVPKIPNLGEPFELRFYTSQFSNVTSISLTFKWDPVFFNINNVFKDTAFGVQRDGVRIKPNINNNKGIASVDIDMDRDLSDSTSDFLCSFQCIPLQDGRCNFSLTNLVVQTIDGGISPKEYSDFLIVANTYSRFDLNNDTVVNELDADLLKKFLGFTILDPQYKEYLDFNADGRIDYTDMLMMAKMFGFQKSPPLALRNLFCYNVFIMSDKGVTMFRKLVFMTIVIMMVVPCFASATRTNPSDFDGVIVVFRHGGELANTDKQTIESVSRDNLAFLGFAKGTLKDICPEIVFKQEIDAIMCAVSANVPKDAVAKIAKLPFVKSVNGISSLEPAGATENADLINASSLYNFQDEKGQTVTGTGIVVGVIDSGVDYRHPDLGAGKYGELGKVIGGTNFLSKADPPIDDDNIGHGTAIAGLISCDLKTKYPGIAPNSRIRSYKVYNNIKQKVAEDLVVSALNQAVKDGCQVVNISLSSPGTGDRSALSQAAESATNSGVVVVGAAGDFGCQNTSTTGAPVGGSGVGQKSICVGSSDMRQGFTFTVAGKNTVIYGMAPTPYSDFGDQNFEIVDGGYGTLDEVASLTLRGKYILLKRGPETGESISYVQKVLNAKRRGAAGVLIWNNLPGELYKMDLGFNRETGESLTDKDLAPSAFISYSDGLYLSGLIKASATQIKPAKTIISGIARFSAMGPTDNLNFKPDFCAPGLGLSTTMSMNPTSLNVPKYTNTFSGTSASAALVSGAAALIKQYKSTWTADDIRLALMNTSTVIMNQNSKQPSSFLIQGAGQINVAAAVNTPAVISPGGIIFTANTKEVILNIKGMDTADLQISTKVFDGLDDKIKLSTLATSKSVSKGKESTLIVDAEFDPDTLDINAQGIIYLESATAKLHVPVVFWKEYAGSSQRPIKTASYNSNLYDYTKPDNKITFQFTIVNGDKFEHKPMKYTVGKASADDETAKYNNLTNLNIDLVDGNGDTWVTIKRFENLEIGYYKFDWEGLDSEMLSKVPNGTYQIKLVQFETVGVKGSTNKTVSESPLLLKGSIKIMGSDITQPPQLFMMCKPFTPSENQLFVVDVYITNAKDVGLLSGEIVYPADEVTVLEAKAKDFIGNDGSAFESDIYIEPMLDDKGKSIGKIVYKQKRSSETGASGWGLIASFIAKCDKSGNPEITFRNQTLYDSKGNWIMHMASPLVLEITTEEPLVGDLNFDGIVDMADIFVFSQSFGLTRADKNFNILADFNNDGIVDGKDYDILRKNLGKRN